MAACKASLGTFPDKEMKSILCEKVGAGCGAKSTFGGLVSVAFSENKPFESAGTWTALAKSIPPEPQNFEFPRPNSKYKLK